ncbi:MAG: hypothetical protein M1832_006278 [Thelocarpon impressellum]|nr:MAG: hypothetical protein M1832_006278 [Thelocarpon impressellum]
MLLLRFSGVVRVHLLSPPSPSFRHQPFLFSPRISIRTQHDTLLSYRGLRAKGSYAPSSSSLDPPDPPKAPSPPRPNRKSTLRLRPALYALLFLTLGLSAGTFVRLTLVPPAPPTPGSPADAALLARLDAAVSALPVVRQLRSEGESVGEWREWPAYSSLSDSQRAHHLTAGPLSGSRGLAVQRVFWNASTGQAISVVYFGPALTGWPGVTHGGAIATLVDESLGRVAVRLLPAKTAEETGVTANLKIKYLAPTPAGRFYVLRAGPAGPDAVGERKALIRGTLETLDGRECVQAEALFVTPRGYELEEVSEGF